MDIINSSRTSIRFFNFSAELSMLFHLWRPMFSTVLKDYVDNNAENTGQSLKIGVKRLRVNFSPEFLTAAQRRAVERNVSTLAVGNEADCVAALR